MEDSNLISKIKTLQNIRPDQSWVISTKRDILRQGMSYRPNIINVIGQMLFQYKLAIASLLLISLTGGTFVAINMAKPGQALYAIKITVNQQLARLSGQDQKPLADLELAAKKLAELNLAVNNKEIKLPSEVTAAVKDYSTTKAAARQQVLDLAQKDPARAAKIVKSVGAQIQQIDATERQVFAALGVSDETVNSIDGSNGQQSDKAIVELLLANADKAALTVMQEQDLAYAQGLYSAGNYEGALEFYLSSSLSQ